MATAKMSHARGDATGVSFPAHAQALRAASMGVARVLAFPETVLFRLPEAATAAGPLDPVFLRSDPARNCLHIYTVFLNLWRTRDFGASLDKLLTRVGASGL
jgi:hypothetical protein